ncbi:MAG: FAD binding domain-containing protein [Thermodesulfobacteriota bacterium]
MRLPEFSFLAPKTLSEACSLLEKHKGHAKLIAGGTDLLVSMKQKIKTPEYVIDLKGIPDLRYIEQDGNGVKIGILTSISALARSGVVQERFPVLADAALSVASPNLRNAATLGGNICLDTRCCYYNKSDAFRRSIGACLKFGGDVCHVTKKGKRCFAVSQADTVPALVALGVKLKIESADETKVVPIEGLYRDDGKGYLSLKAEEIITEVRIPNPEPCTGGSYRKFRVRKATDFALASASVVITLKDGLCKDVRVVLGSVGSRPIRVAKAEEVLRGNHITEGAIEEAADLACQVAKPVANIVSVPPSYRKEVARAMVAQATREALSRVR